MTANPETNPPFHSSSATAVIAHLHSRSGGLSSQSARERLARQGPNEIEATGRVSALTILIRQFQSFIVYILLFAVGFSMLLGEHVDAVVILIILAANTIIGFFQEHSAERSLEALTRMNIVQARVLRDGALHSLNSRELVEGDVIEVRAGDQVPADARIISQNGLQTDESNLTGESLPVSKDADALPDGPELPVADRRNMLYSSTNAVGGNARAVVTATGMRTEIGRIASLVGNAAESRPRTPLQIRLDSFGKRLGYAVIAVCMLVFFAMLVKSSGALLNVGGDQAAADATFSFARALDAFARIDLRLVAGFALVAVSLAVAAVPTALPTIVTVALSIGVKRLLKKNALIRRLSSVETLGNCDIICTDKTGTLTCNQMSVQAVFSLDAERAHDAAAQATGANGPPESLALVYRIGRVCNDAVPLPGADGYGGSPTEIALMQSADLAGIADPDFERIAERPFENERKLMSVLVRGKLKDGGGPSSASAAVDSTIYVKGAADRLLERCSRALVGGQVTPLTDELRARIDAWQESQAARALRVLAFAYRPFVSDAGAARPGAGDPAPQSPGEIFEYDEDDLIFAGLQAMYDPPRPEVPAAIQQCVNAGIRVIMITGDYKETARAIGRQIGLAIPESGGVLTGRELDHLSDEELKHALGQEQVNVFARVTPEHKLRIVTALQDIGHTVAMTGDGVNDSPALKRADIGVAIGSGTAVAREAGDFVLLDDSFNSIVAAIYEGRGIYDNIQKSIMLLLSGNLGEVLIIFTAVMLGMSLPLTAIMLLWINLVTDGAPALAFSVDPYGRDIMNRRALPKKSGILPRRLLMLLVYLGVAGTGLALALFAVYAPATTGSLTLSTDDAFELDRARTMVFNFVVLYEILLVAIIRFEYRVPLFTNTWLWLAVLLSLALQAMILYTPLRVFFGTVPLNALDFAYLGAAGLLFVIAYLAVVGARRLGRPAAA